MQLNKLKPSNTCTLIQISDTHLMDETHLDFVHLNPETSFHAVIEDIKKHYPELDLLVHTGDLAQVPLEVTYQRYLSYMQGLNFPFYQIPGNHDVAEIFPFHQETDQAHVIHLGAWSIVLLNSAVKGQIDGWVNAVQLQQLHEILTAYPEQYFVVACHHHPFEMQSKWIDQHKLKNTEDLTQVLSQHTNVKLVICGHVHQDSTRLWNGIHFLSTPSTSIQFKPHSDKFALDEQAPGYRVVELYENGEFSTEIHRLTDVIQKINYEITGY